MSSSSSTSHRSLRPSPRLALLFVIGTTILSSAMAADPPTGDWPTQAGSMARTGTVGGSVATRRPQVAWEAVLPNGPTSPAVVAGRVYITDMSGGVACHDARTGTQLWRRALTPAWSMTPPTVVGNRVFLTRFNSSQSQALALDTADGATVWSAPVQAQFEDYGAPCVLDNRVFMAGGTYGGLYGFDQATGTQLFFNASLPQIDGWSPSAAGTGVLSWVGGTVRRHVAATGAIERSAVLDANPGFVYQQNGVAAVTADRAVMTSTNGLYSVHPTTLVLQWTVPGTGFIGTPVINGDSVFVVSGSTVQRRAIATGALLATSPVLGPLTVTHPLVVADDAVVATSPGSGYDSLAPGTWILDRASLAMRQRLPIGGQVALADGALFVTQTDPPRMLRLDLLDAAVDPAVTIAVSRNGVPVGEGASVTGDVDMTVTIANAIGQHAQIYGNFLVLHSMDHDAMIETSPWTMTVRVDTRRFFDGENLFSVHVHPHNHHDERHTTDFTFATFRVVTANNIAAPSGDQQLPQFRPGGTQITQGAYGSPILGGSGSLIDDGTVYNVDQFPNTAGPIQIISHLGTSVLGRARWHQTLPPFGDLNLIDGVDIRPFLSDRPSLARIVYFFTDRAGRANYYDESIMLPALTPADAQAVPVPVMHGHVLNLHDGDHLVADDTDGFTVWVRVVTPMPHADRYRSLTLWIGNRAVAVVRMQPYIDAMPAGATGCIIPVVIPASEIAGLLAVRDPSESSRAFALWLDFNRGDLGVQVESSNMANGEHLHLNSVRLASTPWPWGTPTVVITSPYENEATGTQPLQLRYRKWGNLTGVTRALVSIDGAAAVADAGFDGVMPLPVLPRGTHRVIVTLASATAPLTDPSATATVDFTVPNRAPLGSGDGWRTPAGTTLNVAAIAGVLANDSDPDGDPLTAAVVGNPQRGVLTLAANGSFTYVPQAGFTGVDRFTYRASDGTATSRVMTALVLVGCDGRSGIAGSWTTLGNGPGHAGRVSGSLNGRQPVQRWSVVPVESGEVLHPAIVSGRVHTGLSVYFGSGMRAQAFDLASGTQLWRRDFANGFSLNPPTVDGGRVYLQRGNSYSDTQLWSLDAATGQVVWQAPFSAQWERYLAPCVADGKIFINGGSLGGMYGFRQSDGAQLFFNDSLEQVSGWTPTWDEGRLHTQISDHLRAHDPASGVVSVDMPLDTSPTGGRFPVPAVAGSGQVLVRTQAGLASHDPSTLARRWRSYEEGRYTAMPAIADRLVHAPLTAGGLEIRSLDDGALQRIVGVPEVIVGQPIISDDLVIIASETATRALDRVSWQTRWTLPIGGRLSLGQDHLCIASTTPTARLTCYQLPATNVAPLASGDVVVTSEDVPLVIAGATLLANDSDADGNALTTRILTQPTSGTLSAISGGYRYTPPLDWSGTTSFTYVANDGLADSQPATVTITVTPVEDQPAAFKPGLLAQFFDYTAGLTVIPDLSGRAADVTRTDAQIAYASVSTAWSGLPTTMTDTFASRHSGWLKIDTAGSYTLSVSSDDGSCVYLDGALLINNDGLHGMQERSATVTLTAGYHHLRVEFFENGGGAGLELRWQGPGISKQLVPASALWQEDPAPPYVAGLLAEFFDYTTALSLIPDLAGRTPDVSRTDAQIAYASVSTAWSGLPTGMVDTFASRHSGYLKIDTAGSYTLFVSSDDGSRVYLDGAQLIDNDGLHGMQERSATVVLAAGYHPLRVEFFENGGGAGLQFSWSGPGIAKQLVPTTALWRLPAAVAGLPAPWVSADVGAVGLAGSATGDGDDFTVLGSGADIWNNADSFQFVHRPLSGDGELIARVVSLGNTNAWAKAGVMVRAATTADSVHAMMVMTPANGAAFQYRTATAGASSSAGSGGRTAPHWVRIVRSGGNVSGWVSADGIAWTQVGTTVVLPLGATPMVGLTVTAHDNAQRTTAVFDQVVWIPAAGG